MTTRTTRERRLVAKWDPLLARSHPIFWPVREFAALFEEEEAFPSVSTVDAKLASFAQVRFREQVKLPRRARHKTTLQPYDEVIVQEGAVPTREGSWHDFMNALVWAAFPRAKRTLHHHQHVFIAIERKSGQSGRRMPAHDALAVLDEGGVIVASATPLEGEEAIDAAIQRGSARAFVFGHAILEAIAIGGPWPLVRAVPFVLPTEWNTPSVVSAADAALSQLLDGSAAPSRPQDLPRIALSRVASLDEPRAGDSSTD